MNKSMKKSKYAALILRLLGILLIVAAIVIWICSLSTSGDAWGNMRDQLKPRNISTGIVTRMKFNHSYYDTVLSVSAEPEKDHKEEINGYFSWLTEMGEERRIADSERLMSDTLVKYENFDRAGYLAFYDQVDERTQSRQISESYKEMEGYVQLFVKKGKKKTNINIEEDAHTFYNNLVETYGEENIGTFADFSVLLTRMVKTEFESRGTTFMLSEYLEGSFDYDAYREMYILYLEEENEEQENNLTNAFADFVRSDEKDIAGFFREYYDGMKAELEGEGQSIPGYEYFVPAVDELLNDSSFDGSHKSIVEKMVSRQNKSINDSLAGYMPKFVNRMIGECGENPTSIQRFYWLLCRYAWVMIVAGTVLIIVGVLIAKRRISLLVDNYKAEESNIPDDVLLRVEHLCQYFKGVKAVDDVSFDIHKGEVFGLVGESGCGKTTTGRSIIKLYDITSGNIFFKGKRIAAGTKSYCDQIAAIRKEMKTADAGRKAELKKKIALLKEEIASARFDHDYCDKTHAKDLVKETDAKYRQLMADAHGEELERLQHEYKEERRIAKKQRYITQIQMIFQDPVASLDPRMTVREIIAEGLKIRGETNNEKIDKKVYDILETVGLVREHAGRYPHEFSGGQKQRIGVARSVVMNPEMIIADEPVSALDVSIQAQVINLLNELRDKMGLTILFIAHDLSVVKYFSDRIGVMYYGHMVELASSDELFAHPLHPYTESLLSAIPLPDPAYEKNRERIKYNPNLAHDYSVDKPVMREIVPGHFVSCNEAEYEKYKRKLGIM